MTQIIRCKKCILPSSVPGIQFDRDGICNFCNEYENKFESWDSVKEKREQEFKCLLEKARALKRPYDCLVPLSGGKDSTFALYISSKIYGLKTLSVTLDNGFLTEPAKQNIKNALANCNADHIFYTINRKNSSELFRTFILKTGDFCNACMRGINYSIEMAVRNFKVPLIIKGSGRRVQYISQIKAVSSLNTPSYFFNVIRGTDSWKKFKYLSGNKYTLELQKITGGICDILGIRRAFIMKYVPQHIGLYDYIYKPYPEIVEIIRKEMGWNDYAGSTEHLDCVLHDVPFFKDTLKIEGLTSHTFYRSGLIRQGLMTRQEALKLEEEELDKKDVPAELIRFLEKNDIDFEDYRRIVTSADKSKYEPKVQKLAREIYHRLRKF